MKLACLRFWCSLAPLSYPVKSTDPGSHSMIRFRVWIDGKLTPNCINASQAQSTDISA